MLLAVWPHAISAFDYAAAVRGVLAAVGWRPPPPKNQRVGMLVAEQLRTSGPMTYAMLQDLTGLSVGAVANGLKACGAIVVRQTRPSRSGKGSGKATNWYGLPEVRHG